MAAMQRTPLSAGLLSKCFLLLFCFFVQKSKRLTLITQTTLPQVKMKATSQEMSHTGKRVKVRTTPLSTSSGCDERRGAVALPCCTRNG